MSSFVHSRVEAARAGTNPNVICRMPSGWAVYADYPFLPGYTVLLSDPVAVELNALSRPERLQYLYDMSIIGDALLEVTGAYRINYAILCNSAPALHAHIVPRYADEPEAQRRMPPWAYPPEVLAGHEFDAARDRELMERIRQVLCAG